MTIPLEDLMYGCVLNGELETTVDSSILMDKHDCEYYIAGIVKALRESLAGKLPDKSVPIDITFRFRIQIGDSGRLAI